MQDALGDALVYTYTGVRSDTPLETVEDDVAAKRDHNADALLSVGGGSASDTTKAITTFDAEEGRSLQDMKTETTANRDAHIPDMEASKDPVFAIDTIGGGGEQCFRRYRSRCRGERCPRRREGPPRRELLRPRIDCDDAAQCPREHRDERARPRR